MILYLIKSGLCLVVLLGIYLLFLEREKMHRFNRFFLLGALVLGLTVPFLNFQLFPNPNTTSTETQYAAKLVRNSAKVVSAVTTKSSELVENVLESKQERVQEFKAPLKQPEQTAANTKETEITTTQEPAKSEEAVTPTPVTEPEQKETVLTAITLEEPLISLKDILLALYAIGILIFTGRFIVGLLDFYRKGATNRNIEYRSVRLVLLPEPTVPHTFLNTIYVNKEQFESGELSKKILDHELTHAKQKHSLDVLFIELIRIVFWFNPIFYFYKRAIQINHEFLADESVINKTQDSISYQKLLLDSVFPSYQTNLASSFNYSLTKKRFKMMVKESSMLTTISKKVVLLPLLACIVFIFCTEVSDYNKTYEIDGVKYQNAFIMSDDRNSDPIPLTKVEERKKFKRAYRWKYYDKQGNPLTGEWRSYYKDGFEFFSQKDEARTNTKMVFDDGKLIFRLYKRENQSENFTLRNEFNGDTLSSTMVTRNDTLLWKNEFIPETNIILSHVYGRGVLGVEYSTIGDGVDQIYVGFSVKYDEPENIEVLERYNNKGERIPITNESLEEKLGEVKETYLESISDYFAMNVRRFSQQEFDLKYSEVLNNRQRVIAFMNKVNPEDNRSDEILIPRRRWAKGGWALAKPIKIKGKEFMEGRISDEIGFIDIRLYYPLEEKGALGGFHTIYDEYGETFSGETYTYTDQERPILYADENSGSHIVSFYENGKMVRQEGFSDDKGGYVVINNFNENWLKSSIILHNDTLISKTAYDSETGVMSMKFIKDGGLSVEFSQDYLEKKFTQVGLATNYDGTGNAKIIAQHLYDNEGNEVSITRAYLEDTYDEYEQIHNKALSDYLAIEAIPANKEDLSIAYWEMVIAQERRYALELKLNTTGTNIPPPPPSPERRLRNAGY